MAKLSLPFSVDLPRHAGSRPRIQPHECAAYGIGGRIPKVVFSPRNAAEAAKVIEAVRHEGAGINIRGAGSKQWRPPAPRAVDSALDTARCSGILAHTAADLTVTLAAGTPFAELQAKLRAQGQFFPCDPPFAASATVGGVLAARTNGALRQRYGSLRDNVLGMKVCLSDGSVAFSGAKVVKSVAGYDIPKLFVGSFGTLGLIAEATLKIAPLPAREGMLIANFQRPESACDAALQIAASPLFPLATTMHDCDSARHIRALKAVAAGWTLLVRCGGTPAAVTRQLERAQSMCAQAGATTTGFLDADRVAHAWNDVAELAGGAAYAPASYFIFKVAALPSQTASVLGKIARSFARVEITAHPALGIAYGHALCAEEPNIADRIEQFAQQCIACGWHVEYLSAPPPLQAALLQPVPQDAPLLLMRRLKAALDPTGTFDAGRLLAGI